jgi:hypothetical protein
MTINETAKIIIVISAVPLLILASSLVALKIKKGPEFLSILEDIYYFRDKLSYKCPVIDSHPNLLPNENLPRYIYFGDTCGYYGDWVEKNCPKVPLDCFAL